MTVIAVYSVKGGVGKTTIAIDLAWRAAALGEMPTLLWDLDVQGDAGFLIGARGVPQSSAAAIFQRDGKPRRQIVPTRFENLSLLPADESLRGLPLQFARMGHARRLAMLATQLRAEYRRIVLDCPPQLNEISDQVIAAADVLVVPLPPTPLATRALDAVHAELLRNRAHKPVVLPVLSMFDARRKLHREVRQTIAANWPVIPFASPIEQTAVRRLPIGLFDPASEASLALGQLYRAIELSLSSQRAA